MKATIWHNPRCTKSRATLALLEAAGAELTVVEYLKTPPSRAEIAAMIAATGLAPAAVLRRGEAAAAGLAGADDAAILDAMAAHPILIERPLVRTAKGARIGRPPEAVHAIL